MKDHGYKLVSGSIIQNAIGSYLEECGYTIRCNKWYIGVHNDSISFGLYFYEECMEMINNQCRMPGHDEIWLWYFQPDFYEQLDSILLEGRGEWID